MSRGPVRQLAKWGTPRALTGLRRWWTAARWPTALDRLPRALREFRAKWSASEPLIALRRLPHTLRELPAKWTMPSSLLRLELWPRALTALHRWWRSAASRLTTRPRLPRVLSPVRAKWSASEPLIALRRLPHTLSELPEKWSMSRPLTVLNLLLVGISVVFSIQLLRGFAAPAPLPLIRVDRPLVAVVSAKKASGPAGPPLTAYGGIAARNLFNPDRSETGRSNAGSGDQAFATKPVLYGVVIGEETRVAYLEDPSTKRIFGYKVGDVVAGGQLEQIETDRVVIKRVDERQDAEIGAAGGHDGVDVGVRRDVPHGGRGDSRLVTDAITEGRLVEAAEDGLGVGHGLPCRHGDEVAAVLLEHERHLHRLLRAEPARGPVGGRDLHGHRLRPGPGGAHGIEHLEGIAQAVGERSAVVVPADVRQRRDEAREQVAVGHVQLEHVETRLGGHAGGLDELLPHPVHVLPVHLLRHLALGQVRDRRRGDQRPVAVGQRLVDPLPEASRRALAAGVGELERDPGQRVPVDKVHDALPGGQVLGLVHARAARADPALAAHVGHLRHHQRRAAHRPRAQIDEVPVAGGPVLGRVLAHRRDDDAVGEHEVAQPERREHRRRGRLGGDAEAALVSRLGREPAVHRLHELGVADPEVLVGDAQAAREQAEGELDRFQPAVVALGLLEPLEAHLGRPLRALHQRPPLVLVGRQGAGDLPVLLEGPAQRDGVFHGQLGARPDGEVRGVGGVADEHDVPPVPPLVPDRREAAPEGAVLQQPVTGELAGEEPLGEGQRGVLAGVREPGPPPRRLRRF